MSRTLREAAQQALDALLTGYHQGTQDAIAALREALAAPEQEPVARCILDNGDEMGSVEWLVRPRSIRLDHGSLLYAAPPAAPEPSVDDMPGMWEPSDTFGGEADSAAPPAAPAPVPDGWVMVPRGLLRRLIAEALTFDPSLQDKEAIEQAKQLAASPAAPAAPVVPLPEPDFVQVHKPAFYKDIPTRWDWWNATSMHAHAAAVSAAKDAEIERLREQVAGLQIKADLFDLAVRKGLLSVHSELIDPRNHGTRCSWLVGHAKACDISNNAALAARKGTTPTRLPPSLSPRS